eukprot:scaffold9172_cov52-Phaeocystis_antarctica.AAC.3
MLTEERLCKRRSGAASMQLYGGCAPLPAALPEPQSSQILLAACARPSAQCIGIARGRYLVGTVEALDEAVAAHLKHVTAS